MGTSCEVPSSFSAKTMGKARVGTAPRLPNGPRPLTSAQWLVYFRGNAVRPRSIPWGRGADGTPEELAPVARSLQALPLGETSDGPHLRAAAPPHAPPVGDPASPTV